MVRALLDGRKTQTRRILKPQPRLMSDKGLSYIGIDGKGYSPRICVGDRLYVREHWRTIGSLDTIAPRDLHRFAPVLYNADEERPVWAGKHRQAMHMPRWASRLTLTVTDVRVERLQAISEEDADAECFGGNYPGDVLPEVFPGDREQYGHLTMAQCYGRLWDHINGPGAWDANPWVVAYTFTVQRGNIDQIGGAA